MKKSIVKKAVALLTTITLVLGSFSIEYAEVEGENNIEAEEVIYTLVGSRSPVAWDPAATENRMEKTEIEGVYKANYTIPSMNDSEINERRLTVIQATKDSEKLWNRILLGVPQADASRTALAGGALTNIRINVEEETQVIVYFDSKTYGIAVKDMMGNDVSYLISWAGYDDKEEYHSPEEYKEYLDVMEYLSEQNSLQCHHDLNVCGILTDMAIPNFVLLRDQLIDKIAGNTIEDEYVYTYNADTVRDVVKDGEVAYTLIGSRSPVPWSPASIENMMEKTEIEGVYKAKYVIPAIEESEIYERRLTIIHTTTNSKKVWNRILLGVPQADAQKTSKISQAVSNIRINVEKETEVIVYFDSKTYGILIKDMEGNNIPYLISWLGYDDQERYYRPEELSTYTIAQYLQEQIQSPGEDDIQQLGIPESVTMPDFVTLIDQLSDKIEGNEREYEYIYDYTKMENAQDDEGNDNNDGNTEKGISINSENFPDENFRSYVERFDENYDGYLSSKEIESATIMYLADASITSLEGISYFKNLQFLNCSYNNLKQLDVSGLKKLETLYCYDNSLTELNVAGLTNLKELDCRENYLTELNIEGLTNAEELLCSYNELTELNLEGFTNLAYLDCKCNKLTKLNVKGLINLKYLCCENNNLTQLNVKGLTNLEKLYCCLNNLVELNIEGLTNLTFLDCQLNTLTELNAEGLTNLQHLICPDNNLTQLNVGGLTNLEELWCCYNNLAELNVEGLTNLLGLYCYNNNLTELNVEKLTNLEALYCKDNNLIKLELRNLTDLKEVSFEGNPIYSVNMPNDVETVRYDNLHGCYVGDIVKNGMINLKDLSGLDVNKISGMEGGCISADKEKIIFNQDSEKIRYEYDLNNGSKCVCLLNMNKAIYSDSGLSVEYSDETFYKNVRLAVEELDEEESEYLEIGQLIIENISDSQNENNKYCVYEINLIDETGNKVQPNGKVTVTIPVLEGYNGEKCHVYRMEQDNKFTDMNAEYVNGNMEFTTEHFSKYIVTEAELTEENDNIVYGDLNGDGDINSADAVLLKKHLAGYKDLEINEAACDINGDGSVTSADAVILQKYLAGYKDVVLGNK